MKRSDYEYGRSRSRETYQQIAEQANNSDLADRGNEDGGLLLDLRAEVLENDVSRKFK